MDTSYWTTTRRNALITYLKTMTGYSALPLVLPIPNDITATGNSAALSNSRAAIDGLAVAAATLDGKPYVKVGQRIHIRDYRNADVGEERGKCPFARFADCTLRDLRLMVTTLSGRRLLHSLDQNGGNEKLMIVFGHGITPNSSQCNQSGGMPNKLNGAQPGQPVSCTVMYNPLFFGVPKITRMNDRDKVLQVGAWGHPAQKPADVTLFHELVHADDMLRGIFDATELTRGSRKVKISELRAIGLDLFDNESIYSENTYRRDRGFVKRDCYTQHTEITKRGPTVTAGYRALVDYLDKSLMSKAAFVRASRHVGKRKKILLVEQALVDFNREYSWIEDPVKKLPGLISLLKAVVAYKEKSKSKRNVTSLVNAIGLAIKSGVEGLLALNTSPQTFHKLRKMALLLAQVGEFTQGKKISIGSIESARFTYDKKDGQRDTTFSPRLMVEGYQAKFSAPQITGLQADDLTSLQQLAQDNATAIITQNVITEMLALANSPDVTLTDTRAGSNAGLNPNGNGYLVVYGQWNYDDQRLSTLIHELTHVANMQVYKGTPLMLSYAPGLGEQPLRTLLGQRQTNIEGLITLVNDEANGFTPYQKKWLTHKTHGKLPYAIAVPNALSLDNLKKPPGGSKAIYDLHVRLTLARVLTQAAYEYETVLNQLLIYMSMWEIPQNNALHAQVIQLAQAAYDERVRLRAQQAQPRLRLKRSKSTGNLFGGFKSSSAPKTRPRSGSVLGKKKPIF